MELHGSKEAFGKDALPDIGLPTQAEAEKSIDTTATAEEASRSTLGHNGDDAVSIPSGETPPKASLVPGSVSSEIKITRATMALRIEPWRLIPEDARDAHAGGDCGGKGKCAACSLSSALYDVQRDCAGMANLVARTCERMDGVFWDDALVKAKGGKIDLPTKTKLGKDGKSREVVAWPSDEWNGYKDARTAFPNALSGISASIVSGVVMKWKQERLEVFAKMERSAARYKRDTIPIPPAFGGL